MDKVPQDVTSMFTFLSPFGCEHVAFRPELAHYMQPACLVCEQDNCDIPDVSRQCITNSAALWFSRRLPIEETFASSQPKSLFVVPKSITPPRLWEVKYIKYIQATVLAR
jgi:hypothetical protein